MAQPPAGLSVRQGAFFDIHHSGSRKGVFLVGELIFNLILLVFFAAMAIYSGQIEIKDGHTGARYWPMVMLAVIIILMLIKIVKIWRFLPQEQRKFNLGVFKLKEKGVQNLLLSMAWLLLYILVLPYAGFVLSTIILFAGMAWLTGGRKVLPILIASVGITLAVWAVFVWGLDVHPPRGFGILEDFSIWLEYLV